MAGNRIGQATAEESEITWYRSPSRARATPHDTSGTYDGLEAAIKRTVQARKNRAGRDIAVVYWHTKTPEKVHICRHKASVSPAGP